MRKQTKKAAPASNGASFRGKSQIVRARGRFGVKAVTDRIMQFPGSPEDALELGMTLQEYVMSRFIKTVGQSAREVLHGAQ